MNTTLRHRPPSDRERGITLVELVLVIVIVGLMLAVTIVRLGTFDFWREVSTVRKLSELVVFLNNQAVMDQAFYRLEFDFESNSYRVGVMRSDESASLAASGSLSALELEKVALLSPSLDGEVTMIPPPSFPSLAEPTELPKTMFFEDIVTPRGKVRFDDRRDYNPFILFSPRGSSEFAVIHLGFRDNTHVTILVNPWTGLAETFKEYKDFQWTMGNPGQS